MRIVKSQERLEELVDAFSDAPFVTVDTEFMRERTYYPALCLIQIARPPVDGMSDDRCAAIIDPVDADLDFAPLFELLANPDVVKVFHAARQDVEIFHHMCGRAPTPLYDTQIAAMVCGFGDQVGYETLVRKITGGQLDKSSRFTDWSRRPLTERQLSYALADVTHLRDIYLELKGRIDAAGRAAWVAEEMAALEDPSLYDVDPDDAWRRIKTRSTSRKFLSVVKALAAWRERSAKERDIPRQRLLKDDALVEIAGSQPQTLEELGRSRLLFREARKGEVAEAILGAVRIGVETPPDEMPKAPEPKPQKSGSAAVVELLKVLLKARADEMGVAQRLLASAAELDAIACDGAEGVEALKGWRRTAFGEDALKLLRGEIGLAVEDGGGVRVVPL